MQDSRPGDRVVRSMMWQAALGPMEDEPRRDSDQESPRQAPGEPGSERNRVRAPKGGPGSQLRRYVHRPQPKPGPVPPPHSSRDSVEPPD
jgi:hypothetical protein